MFIMMVKMYRERREFHVVAAAQQNQQRKLSEGPGR
jgi:hypothetical protein